MLTAVIELPAEGCDSKIGAIRFYRDDVDGLTELVVTGSTGGWTTLVLTGLTKMVPTGLSQNPYAEAVSKAEVEG